MKTEPGFMTTMQEWGTVVFSPLWLVATILYPVLYLLTLGYYYRFWQGWNGVYRKVWSEWDKRNEAYEKEHPSHGYIGGL